jgi:hypothetical protein
MDSPKVALDHVKDGHAKLKFAGMEQTEDGLFDARSQPKLWAMQTELRRWKELRAKHKNLSDTEISELVLCENIPARLREEHIAKIHAMGQN